LFASEVRLQRKCQSIVKQTKMVQWVTMYDDLLLWEKEVFQRINHPILTSTAASFGDWMATFDPNTQFMIVISIHCIIALLLLLLIYSSVQYIKSGKSVPVVVEIPKEKELVKWILVEGVPPVKSLSDEPDTVTERAKALVVDFGTSCIKSSIVKFEDGVLEKSEVTFPTVVGINKHDSYRYADQVFGYSNTYVGEKATERRSVLKLDYPFLKKLEGAKLREVVDIFFKHCIGKNDTPDTLVFTGLEDMGTSFRELICQYSFETLLFDRASFFNQHSMALYSSNQPNGLVINIGANRTTIVPYYEGYPISQYMGVTEIGGVHLDTILARLIAEYQNGFNFGNSSSELEILKSVKEAACFVSENTEQEKSEEYIYKLPDSRLLRLTKERYLCPEFLFNPAYDTNIFHIPENDHENPKSLGVAKLAHTMIKQLKEKLDGSMFRKVCSHIVICGGSTMFKGFPERFCYELNELLYPEQHKVTVTGRENRLHAAYVGAHMIFNSSVTVYQDKSITRSEYDETGPAIATRKLIL
jgi:centractin